MTKIRRSSNHLRLVLSDLSHSVFLEKSSSGAKTKRKYLVGGLPPAFSDKLRTDRGYDVYHCILGRFSLNFYKFQNFEKKNTIIFQL